VSRSGRTRKRSRDSRILPLLLAPHSTDPRLLRIARKMVGNGSVSRLYVPHLLRFSGSFSLTYSSLQLYSFGSSIHCLDDDQWTRNSHVWSLRTTEQDDLLRRKSNRSKFRNQLRRYSFEKGLRLQGCSTLQSRNVC
jgi:hypothetical protein